MNAVPTSLPALAEQQIGPGHVLGRYELLMPIAAGGMAMVWAARLKGTRGFQKIVAVKTMLPSLVEDDQFEQMFLDEASLASKIRHPNAVEIIDLGEQDGVLFLAMEWIDGVPLNQIMKVAKRHGGVPLTVATRIVMQACAGLHAAHELTDGKGQSIGLVHRDISPQNILVTFDGVAKVVDFGVAKATALGEGTTRAGQVKGKIGYMAPEQGRGEAVDRRADVFALGIVLYALTTGLHPFRKESDAATLFSITSNDPAPAPRNVVPTYPATLERVVLRALEKDREKRFASARDLFHALDKALPLHTRGSDEEVGTFITSLFAEQRQKSLAALRDALERADRHELSELRSSPYTESTRSGVNPVSSASVGVGVTARIVPAHPPPANEVGPEGGSMPSPSSRRLALSAGLGLGAALVAGWLWLGSDKAPRPSILKPGLHAPVSMRQVSASASATKAEASSTPAAAEERTARRAPADGRTGVSVTPAASASVPKSRPVAVPVQVPPPASSAPKKAWKQDPGF